MKQIVCVCVLFLLAASATTVVAECQIKGKGEVSGITSSFPVLEVLADAMESCNNDDLKVSIKLTTQAKEEIPQAFSAATSPYDMAQVANSSFTPLQAAGQLQALDDLVEKYREAYNLEDGMLIEAGGKIMAIAFQVNAQHLYYRKDIFDKHGIEVPTTYDEVLAVAEKLKGEESIEFPLGGTYKSGWNLAQEFVNIYLGHGADLFKPGTAEPVFDGEAGIKTLELMKKLRSYMSPNALALDTTAVMQQFQQGKIAMANFWASRAVKMDDETESKVVGLIEFSAAPAIKKGGKPATTLWWDGFVLPTNMDGDRDLTFQVMMEGLKAEVVENNNDEAIWLRSNYKPTRFSKGAFASAAGGAPSYPLMPQFTLAHSAIGSNIGDYLSGEESASESLKDAAESYRTAAREKGYLK
ncbi:MAG: ABC transporter substrate-binding protein, partial [Desulforhopalus sp.]